MNDTLTKLIDVLKQDERLVVEGKLAKNKVIELALDMDVELLKLLRKSSEMVKVFFQDVDGVLVFDKVKFQSFVSNKQFLPDSFTEYKNKIGLMAGKQYLTDSNEVVLGFPYKDCVLEGGQDKDDAKRDEVFWNETLAPDEVDRLLKPKVLTNVKKYTADGEQEIAEISDTDNLIIKGNNLIVLHTLKKKFAGKVKLIYIDPPFYFRDKKQGDSFAYNSSFKLSTWLTFLRNRLEVACRYLRDDGSIFVQIDDEGYPYIKLILDEIFGIDNFINTIHIKTLDPSGFRSTSDGLFKSTNQILWYGKNKSFVLNNLKKVYIEKNYDSMYSMYLLNKDDNFKKWKWMPIKQYLAEFVLKKSIKVIEMELGKEGFNEKICQFAIDHADSVFRVAAITGGALAKRKETIEKSKSDKSVVYVHPDDDVENFYILGGGQILFYENRIVNIDGCRLPGELVTDLWLDIPYNGIATEGGITLKGGKKPEKLLQRIIDMTTDIGDTILDFYAGSGTSGAVAHKMQRHYILVEQMDYIHDLPETRLRNVIAGDDTGISKTIGWRGGGSFVYAELARANQNFVDAIQGAETSKELETIWTEMKKTAFLSYRIDAKKLDDTKGEWQKLSLDEQKKVLVAVLEKNWLYVPYSEMDDERFAIPEKVKKLNHKFYE